MLRHIAIITIATTALALPLGSGGCSHRDPLNMVPPVEAGVPSFTATDAAPDPDAGLTQYCPTTQCPAPFTTCNDSHFPCDVNLMTDPLNCGSCGFKCEGSGNAQFDCVAGKCALRCRAMAGAWTLDCNGVIDDDCEVRLGSNDNCNGCGDRCPDPANPCIFDESTGKGQCGCGPDRLFCGGSCIDPKNADRNCGGCGITCDPAGGGGVLRDNTYFGCSDSECGHLKCVDPYADCDKDPLNGCETSLLTETSCGACNKACGPGQTCKRNSRGMAECICPVGQTLCDGRCVDLAVDASNCGACGVSCTITANYKNAVGVCNYGSCTSACMQGWGDCNGNPKDGCEVNLNSDQRHCGACGRACDALAGQPCIAGQCAVHPCGEGEEAR